MNLNESALPKETRTVEALLQSDMVRVLDVVGSVKTQRHSFSRLYYQAPLYFSGTMNVTWCVVLMLNV